MARRTDIPARRDEIERWIAEGRSKAFICARLYCKPATLETALRGMGIAYAGNRGGKGFAVPAQRKPVEAYLVRGSHIASHALKLKLLRAGLLEPRCAGCARTRWRGAPIPLELHHRDGDRTNNTFANLELNCPNCHALTPNFAGRALAATARTRKVERAAEAGYLGALTRARGVIGSRTTLRTWRLRACGFESLRAHRRKVAGGARVLEIGTLRRRIATRAQLAQ